VYRDKASLQRQPHANHLTKCDKPGDYFAQPYLTEKGKARLHEEKRRRLEFWLPVIVSNLIAVAALIISIIALS